MNVPTKPDEVLARYPDIFDPSVHQIPVHILDIARKYDLPTRLVCQSYMVYCEKLKEAREARYQKAMERPMIMVNPFERSTSYK